MTVFWLFFAFLGLPTSIYICCQRFIVTYQVTKNVHNSRILVISFSYSLFQQSNTKFLPIVILFLVRKRKKSFRFSHSRSRNLVIVFVFFVISYSRFSLSSFKFQYFKMAEGSSSPPSDRLSQGVQVKEILPKDSRKAPVWEHFNLVLLTDNTKRAQCMMCHTFLTSQGNSTLRRHIQRSCSGLRSGGDTSQTVLDYGYESIY